jgi:hypothetical protein
MPEKPIQPRTVFPSVIPLAAEATGWYAIRNIQMHSNFNVPLGGLLLAVISSRQDARFQSQLTPRVTLLPCLFR